jgi:AcrR family transcriptional regulator
MATQAHKKMSTPKPRPLAAMAMREDVRAYKREIILNAAIDAFYAQGFENTSVDDIAATMSVTKAVLYYNFASKMSVLESIVDRTSLLCVEALDRGLTAGRSPAQRLALAAYFFADHIIRNQKLVAIFFREERSFSPELRARAIELEQSCVGKITEALEAGVATGDFAVANVEFAAASINGMIAQAFHWNRAEDPARIHGIARYLVDATLRIAGFQGELGLDEAVFRT